MRFKNLWCCLLLLLPALAERARAQSDSSAVWAIQPIGNAGYYPAFSNFCPGYVWLGEQIYHVASRHFLTPDSTLSCLPTAALRRMYNSDPADPFYLWWTADPYDARYYWTYEYPHDSLLLWRYDVQRARQDSFPMPYRAGEMMIGPAGIWINGNREVLLLDRRSGRVLNRTEMPRCTKGASKFFRPWGDDLLIGEEWVYQRRQNRCVPFFPLPADVDGCRSPESMEFPGPVCGSGYWEDDAQYAYFVSAPDRPLVRLYFKEKGTGHYIGQRLLAADATLAWSVFSDNLTAFDLSTGDSIVYPGPIGEPLIGDQNGRFLGFQSELGFSFFDKENCRFGVLNQPYGFATPRNFACDQRYIYLTYEDHWEIVDCPRLDTAFRHSGVQEEYQAFEQEWNALHQGLPEDFYTQYKAYLQHYKRYRNHPNPRIADAWADLKRGIEYGLFIAPDSVMERVAVAYAAGYFDPSVSIQIAQGLFTYWGGIGAIQPMLRLLQIPENAEYITYEMQSGAYLIDIVKATQSSLDSIDRLSLPPDVRLYALGKVWEKYCYHKRSFGKNFYEDPWRLLDQSYVYYRDLIRQYPQSPLADNAAYDSLYYIDYQSTTTDDLTPDANPVRAYQAFRQFLKDYPDSDRRPDALLRLARLVLRGQSMLEEEEAAGYLAIIAEEYPDFAKSSDNYQLVVGQLQGRVWSDHWTLQIDFDQPQYRVHDTIWMTVRLYNKSRTVQTLDASFLDRWQEGLHLYINQPPEKGCEERYGEIPLTAEKASDLPATMPVQPGEYYTARFVLGSTSLRKIGGSAGIDLNNRGTYHYNLEYHHPVLTWLYMHAAGGGKFRIE